MLLSRRAFFIHFMIFWGKTIPWSNHDRKPWKPGAGSISGNFHCYARTVPFWWEPVDENQWICPWTGPRKISRGSTRGSSLNVYKCLSFNSLQMYLDIYLCHRKYIFFTHMHRYIHAIYLYMCYMQHKNSTTYVLKSIYIDPIDHNMLGPRWPFGGIVPSICFQEVTIVYHVRVQTSGRLPSNMRPRTPTICASCSEDWNSSKWFESIHSRWQSNPVDGNQKSYVHQLRLAKYPILFDGWKGYIPLKGRCLGFLNHQQYDWRILEDWSFFPMGKRVLVVQLAKWQAFDLGISLNDSKFLWKYSQNLSGNTQNWIRLVNTKACLIFCPPYLQYLLFHV